MPPFNLGFFKFFFWNTDISTKFAALIEGTLAQSVEQQTENLCVPGSIPGGTTRREETEKSVFFPPFFAPIPYL